jgi:protein SCO1/2
MSTMKKTITSMGAAICLLAMGHSAWAQDMHKGHNMGAAADPHAGHKMEKNADVVRTEIAVAITATPLVRQDGSKTTLLKELEGNKPTVVAFFYTSCTTVCPVTSQILLNTQDLLGKDLEGARILSVSIDPEHDTPARLAAYSKKFGAKPQWLMYTGTQQNSAAVQKAFGAYRGDKMNHVPLIFVNSGAGKTWVQLKGFPTAEQVVKELNEQKRS